VQFAPGAFADLLANPRERFGCRARERHPLTRGIVLSVRAGTRTRRFRSSICGNRVAPLTPAPVLTDTRDAEFLIKPEMLRDRIHAVIPKP
jgi:hypothetical protein